MKINKILPWALVLVFVLGINIVMAKDEYSGGPWGEIYSVISTLQEQVDNLEDRIAVLELECVPETEICDGLDNDCDGLVDEGCEPINCEEGEPCDDGDACTIGDVCDSQGACIGGAPVVCDDDNMCTTNSCDSVMGCIYVYNTDPCDDGDMCTINDVCSGGTCIGGAPLDCDDDNMCTTNSCDSVMGCMNLPDFGATCDDGVFCNGQESCFEGSCFSLGDPCDGPDGDVDCTESCDEGSDDCNANDPVGSPCSDGTCNSVGQCIEI